MVDDQIIFVDPGLCVHFVTVDLARELSLIGTVTTIQLKIINKEFLDTKTTIYQLGLLDQHNNMH